MLRTVFRRLSSISSIEEYTRAVDFVKQSNFVEAEGEFRSCLEILKKEQMYGEPSYNFILERLGAVQRVQGRDVETERTLEEVVVNYRARSQYKPQLAQAYFNLFMQYLHSNVNKALLLGQYLEQEEQKKIFARVELKDLYFYQGTALLLNGVDFLEAKAKLTECLNMDPGVNTGAVLHNLACAKWWHPYKFSNDSDVTDEIKLASVEFNQAIRDFQKAIQFFEKSEQPYEPNIEAHGLTSKLSGLSLTNIAEIYNESGDFDNYLRWLKIALAFYKDIDMAEIGRTYVLLANMIAMQEDMDSAKDFLSKALNLLEGRNNCNEVLLYESYGQILQNLGDKGGKEYLEKSTTLARELPYWAERAIHLHIPLWHIN